jgi:hypothetical protein
VILLTATLLVLFGFLAFIVGNVRGYTALAVIGGVLIVGVGASVHDSGLEHKTGVQKTITNESANTTTVETQAEYQQVQLPLNLPLGFLILLMGALLCLQSLTEVDS